MRKRMLMAALGLLCFAVQATAVSLPSYQVGDSWSYIQTSEKPLVHGWQQKVEDLTIARVTSQNLFVTFKTHDSPDEPAQEIRDLDWGRSIDVNGQQQLVSKPMSFPMHDGKKWSVAFERQHPSDHVISDNWQCEYVVTGWEDVTVPAGKFHALKIECNGTVNEMLAATSSAMAQATGSNGGASDAVVAARTVPAHPVSGRVYRAYWYVPETKRYVKSLEETYNDKGFCADRFTEEMVSFHPGA